MPACLFLSPVTRVVILYSDPSLDIAFRLLFLLVSKMQHFLSFHLCYYKPYSACVYFRASLLQYPLFCLCPICTEDIYLPSPTWAVPACICFSLLAPCSATSILTCLVLFPRPLLSVSLSCHPKIPKICPVPAQHGALLSSQGVWDVLCQPMAHGTNTFLWHWRSRPRW